MQISATTFVNDHRASFERIAPHFAPPGTKDQPSPEPKVSSKSDAESIERVKAVLAEHDISLRFSKDPATKALIVQLVDDKTGEEIRQFPSEVSLKLAANFLKLQGNFINATN
jgi:flagellar protein FlaG